MVDAAVKTGDVKIFWMGHAGFKLSIMYDGTEKIVYIDPWIGNPKYPDSLKNEAGENPTPDDADLILITHGHFDHGLNAAEMQKASTKEDCKIACINELSHYYRLNKGVEQS